MNFLMYYRNHWFYCLMLVRKCIVFFHKLRKSAPCFWRRRSLVQCPLQYALLSPSIFIVKYPISLCYGIHGPKHHFVIHDADNFISTGLCLDDFYWMDLCTEAFVWTVNPLCLQLIYNKFDEVGIVLFGTEGTFLVLCWCMYSFFGTWNIVLQTACVI